MKVRVRLILSEGFRVFFLMAAIWSIFAMVVWTGWLAIQAFGGMVGDLPFDRPPHLWHAHEMVFGYGSAAAAGFFLTAVPSWTGTPSARKAYITVAAAIWIAGRAAMWWSGLLPPLIVAVVDLAFLPLLGAKLAAQLIRRPKPQNMLFLGLLAALWVGNLITHLDWAGFNVDGGAGLRGGLMALCAMIAILGGRVTPAFTRNALLRMGVETDLPPLNRRIDMVGSLVALLVPLSCLLMAPDWVIGLSAVIAGALAQVRLSAWRGKVMWRDPLVAVLHSSYGWLGLGWMVWGAALLGLGSEIAGLHLLAIGAVGGMTLAIMSRASLGHTGRALVAPGPVVVAYTLIPIAAVLRWIGSTWFALYYPTIIGSGILWCLAFTLFVVSYLPILAAPRLPRSPEA